MSGQGPTVDPAVGAPIPSQAPSTNRSTAPRLSTRHRRPRIIAFVCDAVTERILRDGLASIVSDGADVRRGGISAAIAAMRNSVTPNVLIVDVSAEDQPLSALAALANVVEPDVLLVVIGELDSIDFYREVTRNLGAADYLCKPLSKDRIVRNIGSLIARSTSDQNVQGNALIVITGARGGVGATTVAANLAGHVGITMRRHSVLFDPDLYFGDASFLLNIKPGSGLRMALESPGRIDSLLAERAAQSANERLDVLSGEEPLSSALHYADGGGERLLGALRRRYNFIVTDLPFRPGGLHDDILASAHQRVVVMLPNLASVRSTLRLLVSAEQTAQLKRPVVVLNRVGSIGGMSRENVEDALGIKIDVAIPDRPHAISTAATMGELAIIRDGSFRRGILDLAQHVAFVGLLDAPDTGETEPQETSIWNVWRRFRRRS